MHDVTRSPAEDRMKLILAAKREARIPTVLVTREAVPEVPAPRALGHIAGQRAHIPDLRCRDSFGSLRQNRVLPPDDIIPAQRVERDQASNIQAAIRRTDLIEPFD